ncbi:hypothetical protein [Pseudoclavibacter soli]|uniref:hypothetical protein n=1 Tax=Pseudoclavibacter soli TaxID=452623 RepID=UPI0003F4C3F4|nr:hypothetical protein [Pseudoclavibacter soli]
MSTSSNEPQLPDAMRAFRPIAIVSALAAVVLLFVDFEGAGLVWRRLLTVGVAAAAVFLAVNCFRISQRGWGILLAAVAVVFLPIWYDVNQVLWWVVDGISIVALLAAAWRFAGPPPEPDPDNLPDRFL